MVKCVSILGSTGSVGRQTLDIVEHLQIPVAALTAGSNVERMAQQCRKFRPALAVMATSEAAQALQKELSDLPVDIAWGEEGLIKAATMPQADCIITAIVGMLGLKPTLAAIREKKRIGLANKETLVAAGSLVMEAVAKNNVSLTPVDSEHSAIFQALQGSKEDEVKRLLITASGGPFRGKKRSELESVTLAQCLNHPNWSMGKKITVDSSTLANKGLEVIEAHWLFNMPYEKIDVVVHPQSIIHSLVEFCDGSVIAQLGEPDMRLPIQYALSYPCRYHKAFDQLDLIKAGTLTFEAPDMEAFPSLRIAIDCGKAGGTLPCVFNAANEEAVYAFLDNKIKYLDITYITEKVASLHKNIAAPCIEDIERADAEARAAAQSIIANL